MKLTAWFAVACLTIACCGITCTPAFGKTLTLTRQILAPNGKPATAARVEVRNEHGKVLCQSKTDSAGILTVNVDENDIRKAIVVIAFPGSALYIAEAEIWSKRKNAPAVTLVESSKGCILRGKVFSQSKVPVDKCRVLVTSIFDYTEDEWCLNTQQDSLVPELTADSATDGSYSIPSFDFEQSDYATFGLLAIATVKGAVEIAHVKAAREPPTDITLFPTTKGRAWPLVPQPFDR